MLLTKLNFPFSITTLLHACHAHYLISVNCFIGPEAISLPEA